MQDSLRLAGYPSAMTTPGRRSGSGRTRVGARPVAAASGKRLAPVVYEMLKERLLEGTYQAGERLSVETLKTEFEVSKQPVMEALHRLAADHRSGHGTMVDVGTFGSMFSPRGSSGQMLR